MPTNDIPHTMDEKHLATYVHPYNYNPRAGFGPAYADGGSRYTHYLPQLPSISSIAHGGSGIADEIMGDMFEKENSRKEAFNASRQDYLFSWELPDRVYAEWCPKLFRLLKSWLRGEGLLPYVTQIAARRYGPDVKSSVPGIKIYYDIELPPRKKTNSGLKDGEGSYHEVGTELARSFGWTFEMVKVDPKPVAPKNTNVWDGFGDGLCDEWRFGMSDQAIEQEKLKKWYREASPEREIRLSDFGLGPKEVSTLF